MSLILYYTLFTLLLKLVLYIFNKVGIFIIGGILLNLYLPDTRSKHHRPG